MAPELDAGHVDPRGGRLTPGLERCVVALALGVVAAVTNYAYWRRAPAAASPVPVPMVAAVSPSQPPADARRAQLQALQENLRQHPDDVRARFMLAEIYFKLGVHDRSLAELRRLQRRSPSAALRTRRTSRPRVSMPTRRVAATSRIRVRHI